MKKILLLALAFFSFCVLQAQKNKYTAYAITSAQKGSSSWTEVRLVNVVTGEELKTIYQNKGDAEMLNARTGRPVERSEADARKIALSKPFATTSAACAYDKKNNRLYYTPMGIAQLRYIDLKAKSPKVYYFENETFGVVKGMSDVASQITRMVIGSDGAGYALSNDGNHLLRFTTKKKPEINDLGPLADDATNGNHSIHNYASYGGDMIADKNGNLYLITASNGVYKIGIESKRASYIGRIKDLPKGYTTNGAVSEGNSKVVVSSSKNTDGYFHFDLNTLQAEKISSAASVYNASDLANGLFAFEKADEEESKDLVQATSVEEKRPVIVARNAIAVFPNPVMEGFFKISFADQEPGRYNIQLIDIAGKTISSRPVVINSRTQIEEFRLPQKLAAGNYMVRVMNKDNNTSTTHQLVIQQ